MLLSIILTTFRRPRLLQRAIDSVLRQALPQEWHLELIVSDDDPAATGKATAEAAASRLNDNTSLRYIVRAGERGGVSRSRNRSLALAQGDWILFLDDDDLLCEGALAALLAGIEATGADFCAGRFQRVREDSQGTVLEVVDEPLRWTGYDQLLLSNVFPMGSFLLRRAIVATGFNVNLRTHEDWLFLLDNLDGARVATIDHGVLQVREAVDVSREHRNQSGGQAQKAADYARIYALHPAPHLLPQRRAILRIYGDTSLDRLIGGLGSREDPTGQLVDTSYGRRWPDCAIPGDKRVDSLAVNVLAAVAQMRTGALVYISDGDYEFPLAMGRHLAERMVVCIEAGHAALLRLSANILLNELEAEIRPLHATLGTSEHGPQMRSGAVDFEAACTSLDALFGEKPPAVICVDLDDRIVTRLQSGRTLLQRHRVPIFIRASGERTAAGEPTAALAVLFGLGYVAVKIASNYLAYHPGEQAPATIASALATVGVVMPTAAP